MAQMRVQKRRVTFSSHFFELTRCCFFHFFPYVDKGYGLGVRGTSSYGNYILVTFSSYGNSNP